MRSDRSPLTLLLCERATAFSEWVQRRQVATILAALIALSVLRSGVVFWNWFYLSPGLLTSWGEPTNPYQSNLLFNALGTAWLHLVGAPDDFAWLAFQALLALGSVIVITVAMYRKTHHTTHYFATAVILSSGVAAVLWREIGRYDFIFIVATTIGVLASRRWVVGLVFSVAAFSAPEQALLAASSLVMLTAVPSFGQWRKRAAAFLGLSVLALLVVQGWFALSGDPRSTRLGLMVDHVMGKAINAPSRFDSKQGAAAAIFQKFYEGLANGAPLLWSYLGASLLLLLVILLVQRNVASALLVALALVGFPLFTTLFFGEDPTRDLVIVGTPMIVVITVVGSELVGNATRHLPGGSRVWLTWAALTVSMFPMIFIFITIEAPFNFLIHMLISWNNGTPIDWSGNRI